MNEENKNIDDFEKLELKFKYLEERYDDSAKFFKIILSSITLIFFFVGIIITVLSVASKSEIENAINRMEYRFEKLAGQSIKEPKLELFYEGNQITNTTNIIKRNEGKSVSINGYYLKNIGIRTADNIRLKLFLDSAIFDISEVKGNNYYYPNKWSEEQSTKADFPFMYVYQENLSLNPSETFSLSSVFIELSEENINKLKITCVLEVFYDSQPPIMVKYILSK